MYIIWSHIFRLPDIRVLKTQRDNYCLKCVLRRRITDAVGDDARYGHGVIYSISVSGVTLCEYFIKYTYNIEGSRHPPSMFTSRHKF